MSSSLSRRLFMLEGASVAVALANRSSNSVRAQVGDVPSFASPVALPAIDGRPDGPLNVITSTSILADLARQVGGERV